VDNHIRTDDGIDRTLKQTTRTIPILVAFVGDDPVQQGFVPSLARPRVSNTDADQGLVIPPNVLVWAAG
jgi:hypothetical protein